MKSLMNNVRRTLATLTVAGILIPSSVWAKGSGAVTSHVSTQVRIASPKNSAAMKIAPSGGLSSHKTPNLSVGSAIGGNSQSGGGHDHALPVASSTLSSGVSRISQLKSPWDSTALPAGGGSLKGVANIRSAKVMDFGGDAKDFFNDGADALTNAIGGPPAPYQPAPGSGYMASIANDNAKFFDHKVLLKTTNRNLVSKEIEKKYYDTHPSAQKNLVK